MTTCLYVRGEREGERWMIERKCAFFFFPVLDYFLSCALKRQNDHCPPLGALNPAKWTVASKAVTHPGHRYTKITNNQESGRILSASFPFDTFGGRMNQMWPPVLRERVFFFRYNLTDVHFRFVLNYQRETRPCGNVNHRGHFCLSKHFWDLSDRLSVRSVNSTNVASLYHRTPEPAYRSWLIMINEIRPCVHAWDSSFELRS